MDSHVLPYLRAYDSTEAYPYAELVVDAMESAPAFHIESSGNGRLVKRRTDTNV